MREMSSLEDFPWGREIPVMDINAICTFLSPHIPIAPLRDLITQYSVPPSIASYGLSFSKKALGRISIRSYYEVSVRNKDTGEEMLVTSEILQEIHISVRTKSNSYDTIAKIFMIYGSTFFIELILHDPARTEIYSYFPHEAYACKTCHLLPSDGSDQCPDCFDFEFDLQLRNDDNKELRDKCEALRSKGEKQIPDEEITGSIFIAPIHIEYSLKSVFCAICRGKHIDRMRDYNRWEGEVRSLPIVPL